LLFLSPSPVLSFLLHQTLLLLAALRSFLHNLRRYSYQHCHHF
jgi:hypothetical protein